MESVARGWKVPRYRSGFARPEIPRPSTRPSIALSFSRSQRGSENIQGSTSRAATDCSGCVGRFHSATHLLRLRRQRTRVQSSRIAGFSHRQPSSCSQTDGKMILRSAFYNFSAILVWTAARNAPNSNGLIKSSCLSYLGQQPETASGSGFTAPVRVQKFHDQRRAEHGGGSHEEPEHRSKLGDYSDLVYGRRQGRLRCQWLSRPRHICTGRIHSNPRYLPRRPARKRQKYIGQAAGGPAVSGHWANYALSGHDGQGSAPATFHFTQWRHRLAPVCFTQRCHGGQASYIGRPSSTQHWDAFHHQQVCFSRFLLKISVAWNLFE